MTDALVVGGGPAGATAAARLARAGRRVVLIERDPEPRDRLCGEFLSGEAGGMLAAIGVDPAALGGVAIGHVRLHAGPRTIAAPLPFVATGLSRRRLDAVLLAAAERAGAVVHRGVAARRIEGRAVETAAGTVAPPALLLASGKHEVRGAAREAGRGDDGFVGFKTYLRLPPARLAALAGAIEVTLFDGGYAGLQCVEGGRANLCLAVRRGTLAAWGGGWADARRVLAREPGLAAALGEGEELLPRPLAIAGVPYGFVHRGGGEAYRLGDQAAVIPSFSGDGMAIALHSARRAAAAVIAGAPPARYHAGLRRDVARQIGGAMLLQHLAERPAPRAVALAALRLAPGLLTRLAAATRVPPRALAAALTAG